MKVTTKLAKALTEAAPGTFLVSGQSFTNRLAAEKAAAEQFRRTGHPAIITTPEGKVVGKVTVTPNGLVNISR